LAEYPEESEEFRAVEKWKPWINEVALFLDGKGTFKFFKYAGSYSEQPAIDIIIYRIVQSVWVEETNRKINGK